jgi:nitrogen-specific signal transduction histidine kinase
MVLSQDNEVRAYNETLLEQLGIAATGQEKQAILREIEGLKYDPGYCGESNSTLSQDISAFSRSDVGAVLNFKPVRVQEKYLDWRGKVALWDDEKVCILTVRDTSEWVALDVMVKKESECKTALLRSVSHELRTPANAILNLALDIQATEPLSPQGKSDVEVIVSATNFLLCMINDLLDYSRILNDKFLLNEKLFLLEPVIKECAQLISPQCRGKELEFSIRYDSLLPQFVYTDENRLKQVILNLLSNAVK